MKSSVRTAQALSQVFAFLSTVFMPVMPALMALLLMDSKYIRQYKHWIEKFKLHFKALNQGPVEHYLSDVFLRYKNIPVEIQGECTQCGNCCLNKQCAFLEPVGDEKFQCGIYNSNLKKFSNCSSFPLHAQDIERYSCPGYKVISLVLQPA